MVRKRKDKKEKLDPFERVRLKKLRAQQRREERKRRQQADNESPRSRRNETRSTGIETNPDKVAVKDPHDWIRRSSELAYAWKIVNNHRVLPYWLSIDFDGTNPPSSGYYPCHMFCRRNGRFYYGFLFRECRDVVFNKWQHEYDARKELTPEQ